MKSTSICAIAVVLGTITAIATAGERGDPPPPTPTPPPIPATSVDVSQVIEGYQQTYTVMVPQTITEEREIDVIRWVPETTKQKIQVARTIMVPETRVATIPAQTDINVSVSAPIDPNCPTCLRPFSVDVTVGPEEPSRRGLLQRIRERRAARGLCSL